MESDERMSQIRDGLSFMNRMQKQARETWPDSTRSKLKGIKPYLSDWSHFLWVEEAFVSVHIRDFQSMPAPPSMFSLKRRSCLGVRLQIVFTCDLRMS